MLSYDAPLIGKLITWGFKAYAGDEVYIKQGATEGSPQDG